MQNLKPMFIYKSLHDHYVIPFMQDKNGYWYCQTFYHDKATNTVTDQGYFWYNTDGTCEGVKERNIHQMIALSNVHPKVRKVIKEWKTEYKRTHKLNKE